MYELLCKEFGRDTGVFFQSLTEAVNEAHPGDEIWQIADDVHRTRMVMLWPEQESAAERSAATRES